MLQGNRVRGPIFHPLHREEETREVSTVPADCGAGCRQGTAGERTAEQDTGHGHE